MNFKNLKKLVILALLPVMLLAGNNCVSADGKYTGYYANYPQGMSSEFMNKTDRYDRVDYFDVIKGRSHLQISTAVNIGDLLALPSFRALINNRSLALELPDTPLDTSKYYNMCDPMTAFRSYWPIGTEEIPDVVAGTSFLRVNKAQNIIYTVSKSGNEYIFTVFGMHYDDTVKDMRTCLSGRWKVKKIPDIRFFKSIRPNITTADDVRANDTNFSLNETGGEYISHHVFADELGSIAWVHYKKHDDGRIYVDRVEWESSGWNVLPYLLPIDRQLVDPNYVQKPSCIVM